MMNLFLPKQEILHKFSYPSRNGFSLGDFLVSGMLYNFGYLKARVLSSRLQSEHTPLLRQNTFIP